MADLVLSLFRDGLKLLDANEKAMRQFHLYSCLEQHAILEELLAPVPASEGSPSSGHLNQRMADEVRAFHEQRGLCPGQVERTPDSAQARFEAAYGPPDDPWAHRSEGMRCRSCMWFVEKAGPPVTSDATVARGRCRRRSPTMSGYPVVFVTDWCGDHKLA